MTTRDEPPTEWVIDCIDAFDRAAQVTVRIRERSVTVQCPPGESACFTAQQARRFHRALLAAGAGWTAGRRYG